ncbi:MAG: hypothetical protein ACYCUY_00720 [Acidithiobacillus sp.]
MGWLDAYDHLTECMEDGFARMDARMDRLDGKMDNLAERMDTVLMRS